MLDARQIQAEIIAQTRDRGPEKSICPSEVARALSEDWRPLMGTVRRAAAALAESGEIDILRKGKPIAPTDMHGVIRLRAKMSEPTP